MSLSYRAPTLARQALSLVLRSSARQYASHNPLKPSTPTDSLGLPLTPQPPPIPTIKPTQISRETLVKLHKLSALNPPPEGSIEEAQVKAELSELIGLMDIVKEVELPPGDLRTITQELLGQGVGSVVFDQLDEEAQKTKVVQEAEEREKHGKELLEWATKRVGDYYSAKVK